MLREHSGIIYYDVIIIYSNYDVIGTLVEITSVMEYIYL